MRILRAAAVVLTVTGAGACAPAPSGESVVHGADELRAAATSLPAGASMLTLEVEAWRSFQPIIDDGRSAGAGDPLIAVLRVEAGDGGEVPGALAVNTVYLVRGSDVVRVTPREEQPRTANARTVEFVVRDGPRWATGDTIDVVASVSGLSGGPGLLRAPRVAILRVD